ncbi:MAG TPA: PVC-type heme-binding CxxCH protein [Vicinamibacterales bacterium]|nr:PVC-type heme-binding CxxCH protein [Vicinamibacterales bacterium]
MSRTRVAVLVAAVLLACLRAAPAGQSAQTGVDREYVLSASMLGYLGTIGEIEGVRNPTLWARTGETVRITIVNGEMMVHDLVLEKLGVKSLQILDKGATASITFKATQSDTYFCSVPGHRQAGMVGRLEVSDQPRPLPEGTAPAVNGRALNLDFEKGTLDDWTVTGDAFEIVKAASDSSARVGSAGGYWVSSASGGSARKGSLSSVPFTVTHPYASFLVSGGAFDSTRVELVSAEARTPIYTISGADQPRLRPAVVDLRAYAGKDIFVRVVDDETGAPTATYIKENPWAHINFDHFRFHDARPSFVNEITPADITTMPPMDPIPHAGLSARDAARAMTVPKGFSVTLAASEPDVVRPIAFAYDDRGRLWVAEGRTYPVRAPEGQGRDRILILEDTNGDGRLDRRKVFIENLNLLSGIEVGFGGVWVGAAPYLLFIPVVEGEDRPAGPPQVMLDGWGYQDTHEVLNSFIWGPDGWLYGAHGVFTQSNVGKPGATDAERQRLNAGIWRFHPTKHVFEVFAEGTSNPWGLDFNDHGHAFTTVCVIEHLFHVVQGARYKRQAGKHFNPYVYDDVKTIADHVHWVGKNGPHAGNGRSAAAGGGHAHVGAMIYLGGDNWPAEYRNSIFMNNIHGARTNTDRLQRSGSGYSATHGPDFLLANDSWSQMLNFRYGPDGSVHVIDWYDKNQCHSTNPDIHQKTLGRIFKISHAKDPWVSRVNLRSLSSDQLVRLQLDRNDWYVRTARRILQERGPDAKVHAGLKRILQENPDVTRKLRALWALHVTAGLTENDLLGLLGHESEYLRSWAVYLLVEGKNPSDAALREFVRMAREDQSPLVRLYLASAMQRTPVEKRWDVLAALLAHDDDAMDQNLPLMIWYAAEPVVGLDMARALGAALDSKLPRLFPFTVQRIGAIGTQDALRVLTDRLGRTENAAQQKELVGGINAIVNKK